MIVLGFLLACAPLICGERGVDLTFDGAGLRPVFNIDERVRLSFRGDRLVIENKNGSGTVMIDEEGELRIDERQIPLDKEQQQTAIEYRDLARSAFSEAEQLADKGVKVGLKGAVLGMKAVVGVFRLLLPGDNSEAFERDMEKNGKAVEEKAALLEEDAAALEKMIEVMKELHEELRRSVPELQALEWF